MKKIITANTTFVKLKHFPALKGGGAIIGGNMVFSMRIARKLHLL